MLASSTYHSCLFFLCGVYTFPEVSEALVKRELARCSISVEHAALVCWDHVLDVNEGILSAVHLEELESLLNEVTEVASLSLGVVDLVSQVEVLRFEKIHHWQDLSVVGHESLANGVRAGHQSLQDLQSDCDDFWVTRVKCG